MGCVAGCNMDRPESLKTRPRAQEVKVNSIFDMSDDQYMNCGHFITKSKMKEIIPE